MKFVLESVSKCSGRLGVFTNIERLPDRTFKTPLLLYLNPQLSREVLELSGFDLSKDFAISLPVFNVEQMEKAIKLYGKGVSEFHAMKESLTMVTLKNSSEWSPSFSHEKGTVPIFKKSGRINISSQRYMEMMETFQPDFFTTLADGDTFKDCAKKRVMKSCERSEEMFEDCIRFQKSSAGLKNSFMLASVVGGFNEWERKRMVEQLKSHEDSIGGYFIDGLHRNGDEAAGLEVSSLVGIVDFTIKILPQDKVKMMLGAYLPQVTLELIKLGVDVFDTSFVNLVTSLNRAITFNFSLGEPDKRIPEIDLVKPNFKDDFAPFVDGCECVACRNHTRAYTNHLLNTNELLGPMLLTIHNLHHYQKFFEAIRESIKADKLPELAQLVAEQYRDAGDALNYELKIVAKPKDNKENK